MSPERPHRGTGVLIGLLGWVPALVLGRFADALVWNRAAYALLAGLLSFEVPAGPGGRPDVARPVFLDRYPRELYADWRGKARDAVADLRRSAAGFRMIRGWRRWSGS